MGKTRLVYEFIGSHHTHGWLVLASSSVSYGKATAYLPVRDLLKAYFQIEDRDDGHKVREKLTGKLLTLDAALRPTLQPSSRCWTCRSRTGTGRTSIPRNAASALLRPSRALLLRESQVQPLLLVCSRTCTGSTPRPRQSLTA